MKLPKNRETVYVVVRRLSGENFHVVGVFSNPNDADDYAGACKQEWLDKYKQEYGVQFDVQVTSYYG